MLHPSCTHPTHLLPRVLWLLADARAARLFGSRALFVLTPLTPASAVLCTIINAFSGRDAAAVWLAQSCRQ